jgi:hypothetical protein
VEYSSNAELVETAVELPDSAVDVGMPRCAKHETALKGAQVFERRWSVSNGESGNSTAVSEEMQNVGAHFAFFILHCA